MLPLVCLSKGEMHVILALSENIPLLKLLLIVIANDWLKTFADSFISFGRILSVPVGFLASIFLVLRHEQKLLEGGCFQLWDCFQCYFLL